MENIKFDKLEIIVIIKEFLNDLENSNSMDDEFYLPNPIEKKIDKMTAEHREEFFNICDDIASSLVELKSGELNEINLLHSEIIRLANLKLKKYISF
ncbi:hypothetical protein [Clostridium massiliamazoniense]|uniref:hypothetical protein n=1 Tax=Clostridium massiliamazoniense TaxID=1347366 RepID=UPI0006D85BDC|nr:hypothetical protein [Clostridium massiliamazoniense]